MDLEKLRTYCLSLPGTTEDIKWGDHLCFCVGMKLFIITSPDSFPVNASFKTDPETFAELISMSGFKAAPYLARNHWIHIEDISRMSFEHWKQHLKKAHALVAKGLTKKMRADLGIEL